MNWKKLSSMAFRLLMFIILMVEPTSDLIKTYKSNLNRTGVSSLVVSFVPLRNSRWVIPHPERPCATQKEFLHSRGVFRKVCKAMYVVLTLFYKLMSLHKKMYPKVCPRISSGTLLDINFIYGRSFEVFFK